MTHPVEDPQFAIYNHKEIVFILEGLVKSRTHLSLDAQGGVGIVSAVLAVSTNGNYIYLDISGNEETDDKILASKLVKFSTQSGVKVRWRSSGLKLVALPDGNAFEMATPEVVERIQRREYFRLHTPQGGKALVCQFPTDEDECYEATIVDMSVGGIGVSVRGTPPHEIFEKNTIIEGCRVEFPVVGIVPMTLKICSIRPSSVTKSGEQMYHIGMEFQNLSRGGSNVVQRYMIQLESERISVISNQH